MTEQSFKKFLFGSITKKIISVSLIFLIIILIFFITMHNYLFNLKRYDSRDFNSLS